MNLIPYEEFEIDENILNKLNEHYVNRRIKEYLDAHGEIPSSGMVESFSIPSNLMEEYKKYYYAEYCRKEIEFEREYGPSEDIDTGFDFNVADDGGGYRGRLHFKLDWQEKTIVVTKSDDPIVNPSSAAIWLYIGYLGSNKSIGMQHTSSYTYELTTDVDTDWGFLIRTSTTSWDNGTKWGAVSGNNVLTFGEPLVLTNAHNAESILFPLDD